MGINIPLKIMNILVVLYVCRYLESIIAQIIDSAGYQKRMTFEL